MEAVQDPEKRTTALNFAKLYRDCVESFSLIHQGKKEWNRAHRLLLVKIGIEQAKLLAWSQIMGVCELGEYRDPRLDDSSMFNEVESIVRCMLDRLVDVDHGIQLATYGMKPSKKSSESLEPALDSTRLESFREQYMILPNARYGSWEKSTHWTISDETKFSTFVADTRDCVNRLVEMMSIAPLVESSVKQDIRAMGWHPVFDRIRAANDGSKLRLIKEACKVEQPVYSAAADVPLDYLNTQWSDSYQEIMALKYPNGNPLKTQLDKSGLIQEAKEKKFLAGETSPRNKSFSGMLHKLRSHSWQKRNSTPSTVTEDPPRSKSLAHPPTIRDDEHLALSPERSKSDVGMSIESRQSPDVAFVNPFSIDNVITSGSK